MVQTRLIVIPAKAGIQAIGLWRLPRTTIRGSPT